MAGKRKISWMMIGMLLVNLLVIGVIKNDMHTQAAITGVVATQSGYLRVRSEPNGTQIGSIAKGSAVSILEETGDGWYKISYGDGYGYVSKSYISITNIDSDYKSQLIAAGFPESYCDALVTLHDSYPNWEFVPWQTNLNWEDVLNAESAIGKNTIKSSSISSYKSIEQGAYNTDTNKWVSYDSGGWVTASRDLVAYYLDPRNFLDPFYVFLFMDQSYDADRQTEASVKSLTEGTFLAEEGYSSMLINAAAASGVSPYVLVSMILIEQGANGGGASISGTEAGFEGYYNFYNVGAYATSTMTAVQRGLWYARGGNKGATSYNRPWNSKEAAITGGAYYYGSNYVAKGQNTLYLKKFNVQGSELYGHQYMTNVQGAASEAFQVARAYNKIADGGMRFVIPIYNNMPQTACAKPTGTGECVNFLKNLWIDGIALAPEFNQYTQNYSMIVDNSVSSITVHAEALQASAGISGNVGTVALNEGMNVLSVTVTAQNGVSRVYTLNIYRNPSNTDGSVPPLETTAPEESAQPTETVAPEESEQPLETVQPDGGMANTVSVAFPEGSKEVTGTNGNLYVRISSGTNGAQWIGASTVTGGSLSVTDKDGNQVSGNIATGMKTKLLDGNGSEVKSYQMVLNGDLSGDGKVTVIDLLRLQKGILGKQSLTEEETMAGDMNESGDLTVIDLLKLQKMILQK